jgi:hypothetical protein
MRAGSLVERHVEDVLSENQSEDEIEVERKGRQSGKYKKVCTTDPDVRMATNARNRRLEPAYKQHTAVDVKVGVILDVEVTTGQTNEGYNRAANGGSRGHQPESPSRWSPPMVACLREGLRSMHASEVTPPVQPAAEGHVGWRAYAWAGFANLARRE